MFPWYAVRTKSKHEAAAASYLRGRGLEEFFPTYQCRRVWSDRVKVIDTPLFPGYLFCRFDEQAMLPVLEAPGVVHVVGFGGKPAAVPEEEVAAVRKLARSGLPASPCPYLREGMQVRIRSGPMQGVEGRLTKIKSKFRFVLSVDMLQRSVAVEVDPETVEALK
jgi:transcription antitermination factor NusG